MSLVPFNRQNRLAYKPMTNLLDDFFGDDWRPTYNLLNETFKMDVREELLHYTVEAEMPGIPKEDIGIAFRDGRLTISVNHKDITEEESAGYVHRERRRTSAQRSVYLAGADGSGITAALTDGVLRITIPKEEEAAKNSKINIK